MIFLWKYYPSEELDDQEDLDYQICITDNSESLFIESLYQCKSSGKDVYFDLVELQESHPHHIDNENENFYLENTSFEKLAIKKGRINCIREVSNNVEIHLTENGIDSLIEIIAETKRAPVIYENFLLIEGVKEQVKLVFWGCYMELPIFC